MRFLTILKNPAFFLLFLGFLSILLTANAYFVFFLPGSNGYACIPGGNITASNIIFALFLSFSTAFLLTAMIYVFQMPKVCSIGIKSKIMGFTGISATSGIFTVFCTLCTLPLFSLLGVSVGFSFFTIYNGWFKGISILFSLISLIVIQKHLKQQS